MKTLCIIQGALLALVLFVGTAHAAQKPNILLIFTDDLGATALGCTGSDLHQTPHLDKLAAEGVLFTRAYSAAHVCSASRAAFLTGKAPARLHITDFLRGSLKPYAKLSVPDWTMGLTPEDVTLAKVLKPEGYATAWLGKWHAGANAFSLGFDKGHQSWLENRKEDENDPKGVFTLNKEAMAFIEGRGDKPFFVALSHYSPHGPIRYSREVMQKYEKILAERPSKHNNAGFAAMIEALDQSVGEILDWLDKKGLAKDTLVIFTSDNGGEPALTNNLPLRDGKGSLYEGGVRVPLLARWPGHLPAGATNETRVSGIDFFPTFAALVGAQIPPVVDGMDLSAVFRENQNVDRGQLYWHYPHYHNQKPCGSILDGEWKLIEWFETGKVELYNLATDPWETKDMAETEKAKAEELLAQLKTWRKSVNAQQMTPNPNYDPAREREGPEKKKKKVKKKKQK